MKLVKCSKCRKLKVDFPNENFTVMDKDKKTGERIWFCEDCHRMYHAFNDSKNPNLEMLVTANGVYTKEDEFMGWNEVCQK